MLDTNVSFIQMVIWIPDFDQFGKQKFFIIKGFLFRSPLYTRFLDPPISETTRNLQLLNVDMSIWLKL